MTTTDQLIENDLQELLGGVTPPDLIARTLARIEAGEDADAPAEIVPNEADSVVAKPAGQLVLFRRLATAACMILALGLMTWVLWPKPLPETVTPSTAASYLVRDDHIELKTGWLLLEDGAPEVRVDVGRVNSVHGRTVAGVGIPDEDALDSIADQLNLSATEREMFKLRKRWLTAGGLALCLFTGTAMLNDTLIDAEDLPKPEVKREKIENPKPDDIEGVRKLVRSAVSIELMVDGKTLQLTDLLDVRRITEALTATGFATSDKNLSWDPYDGVTMFLADGRKITTSGLSWEEDVYDMSLPGTEGFQTYVTPGGAHDVLRGYFDRAKKGVEIPKADEIKMIRELMRTTVSISVNRDGRLLKLTDPKAVARVVDAMATDEMKASSQDLSFYDPWDWVWFNLPDGTSMLAVGLSQGSDTEKGYFDMELPGWGTRHAYSIPSAALPVLKDLFKLASQQPKLADKYKPLREWKGADSEITEKRCEVVTDADLWSALWMEHSINPADDPTNPPALPDVDFAKEMVVAVFGGKKTNSRGYFSVEMLEGESSITLRVDETTYQTVNGFDNVTAYGFFVIAKTELSVVVEENVQPLKNVGPLWKNIGGRTPETILSPEILWQPSYTRIENGGPGKSGFHVIYNLDQWRAAIKEAGVRDELWPMPDFGKNIAFLATGSKLKGLPGNLTLTPAGWNMTRAIVRLSRPVGQSKGNPEFENIYGVWVFSRPGRDIVLETEVLSMTEPTRWQEAQTFRLSDEPFGIHGDIQGAIEDIMEEGTRFLLIKDQKTLDEAFPDAPKDWVDWSREAVVLIQPGKINAAKGMLLWATDTGDNHVITYSLHMTPDCDEIILNRYAVLKVRRPAKTIVVRQILSTGPELETVSEVARFEK